MAKSSGRIVYSSERGRVSPRSALREPVDDEPVPTRVVLRLRIEKTGRGGKTVTVIDGLPNNASFAATLAQELKRSCGTGGALRSGAVELQGDLRERARELLTLKGYTVKG